MVREVEVLEGGLAAVEGGDLDLDDEALELLHENVEVFVMLLADRHQLQSEVFSFEGLIILLQVGVLLVPKRLLLTTSRIVVYLLQQ